MKVLLSRFLAPPPFSLFSLLRRLLFPKRKNANRFFSVCTADLSTRSHSSFCVFDTQEFSATRPDASTDENVSSSRSVRLPGPTGLRCASYACILQNALIAPAASVCCAALGISHRNTKVESVVKPNACKNNDELLHVIRRSSPRPHGTYYRASVVASR